MEQANADMLAPAPTDMLRAGDISYDDAWRAAQRLRDWAAANEGSRNEATTRKHLIDRIFFESLGWRDEDVELEEHTRAGFIDYTLSTTRPTLVVEAKREGTYFNLPITISRQLPTLAALRRVDERLDSAITQVSSYTSGRGVGSAIVTNGHQLVAFLATRTDGIAPDEGRCFVIKSLAEFVERFAEVWNALSRPAFEVDALTKLLTGARAPALPPKLSQGLTNYPGVRIRNQLQAQLLTVSELVLEDLIRSREYEPRFLAECYCESGALAQYSLSARTVLQHPYSAIFDEQAGGLVLQQMNEARKITDLRNETLTSRPMLVIGDVGVGKSTFIKHLLIEDESSLAPTTLVLYLDLGQEFALTGDLRSAVLDAIKGQLYDNYAIDVDDDGFVRGVYHKELKRFAGSIYKRVRDDDPAGFTAREVRFLEGKVYENTDQHLQASLWHITTGRGQRALIIIDNCDQRDDETQQQAFLIGQEMAANWPAAVFVSLRPETFNASKRRGALTAYHAKAFTIAPPRLDLVVRKRLEFARKITRGELPLGHRFGATTIQLTALDTLIGVFLRSLDTNVKLLECIDNISGANVRLALGLIRGFFGSGHVASAKIIDRAKHGGYTIALHEFLRAIIFGDSLYYDPSSSPAANIFDVSSADPKEHFLQPLILGFLDANTRNHEGGMIAASLLYDAIQGIGFLPGQIDTALSKLVRRRLVQSAGRRVPEPGQRAPKTLRITSVGEYHLLRLARSFTYYDAISVDLIIFNDDPRAKISDATDIEERVQRVEVIADYLDKVWRSAMLSASWFDWTVALRDLRGDCRYVRRSASRNQASRASARRT